MLRAGHRQSRDNSCKPHYVLQNFALRGVRFPSIRTPTRVHAELVRLKVDVIVTRGSAAALVAREATGTSPIVMATSGHPLRDGIVANLDLPLGNVTGLHTMAPAELGSRRLQLLKQATPASSRVGIIWNPLADHPALLVKDTEKAAGAMRVQLANLKVRTPGAFEPAFETALMDQVDALIVVEDYLTFTERGRIVDF